MHKTDRRAISFLTEFSDHWSTTFETATEHLRQGLKALPHRNAVIQKIFQRLERSTKKSLLIT